MMAFVFAPATGWPNRSFKISSSVCSSIQNIFISVLLHPKGNVNYCLDWLKLIKLQQVKENSILLIEKRSRSMLALNMDLHTVWRRLFTWHTMRVRHFCVYCRFKSGSFFSFDILILANHNLSFFPNILVNILCFLLHEIHIFALRWRNESKRSSQLRTLLN